MKILKVSEPALTCFSVAVLGDTEPNTTYYVQHRGGAQTICNCPDFLFRGFMRGKPCKHMVLVFEAVQQVGGWVELCAAWNPAPATEGGNDG